jgi:HSP20 family protein
MVLLFIDLPGVDKSNIYISIESGVIIIMADRPNRYEAVSNTGKPGPIAVISERKSGRFQRSLSLPVNADCSNTRAYYFNGILHLTIPKIENSGIMIPISFG